MRKHKKSINSVDLESGRGDSVPREKRNSLKYSTDRKKDESFELRETPPETKMIDSIRRNIFSPSKVDHPHESFDFRKYLYNYSRIEEPQISFFRLNEDIKPHHRQNKLSLAYKRQTEIPKVELHVFILLSIEKDLL